MREGLSGCNLALHYGQDSIKIDTLSVMAGLDPAIAAISTLAVFAWMPGSGPGMTVVYEFSPLAWEAFIAARKLDAQGLPFGSLSAKLCHMAPSIASLHRIETAPASGLSGSITDEEGAAMFRAALNLFRLWGVTDEEAAILLDLPLRSYRRWKAGSVGRLGRDGKARLSNLMGIHKALRIVFSDAGRGYRWIKAPNEAFGGRSALDIMLGGELTDLMRVRRYLDAERGAW
jgi:uncharacterized protein (DUF2384 family)